MQDKKEYLKFPVEKSAHGAQLSMANQYEIS